MREGSENMVVTHVMYCNCVPEYRNVETMYDYQGEHVTSIKSTGE